MVITSGNITKKAGAKSKKVTWLICTIHPYVRLFFDAISTLQLLAANDSNVFSSVKYLRRPDDLSLAFYAFYPPQIKIIPRSIATNSQVLATDTRTRNFRITRL
jgi:hypothetical protein